MNENKNDIDAWLDAVRSWLNVNTLSLLDPNLTSEYHQKFNERLRLADRGYSEAVGSNTGQCGTTIWMQKNKIQLLKHFISSLSTEVHIENGILLHCFDDVTGVIQVPFEHVIEAFPKIWLFTRRDLCYMSKNPDFGICVAIEHHDQRGRGYPQGALKTTIWSDAEVFDSYLKDFDDTEFRYSGRSPLTYRRYWEVK